jgi:DNA mismatch endonuclease, patch repair protein
MDTLSPSERSARMASVHSTDTEPERKLRSLLHKLGYRFTLHRRDLPGSPDIVLPKYSCVIFVHGCYWHGHSRCKAGVLPKSNIAFWRRKIQMNKKRDKRVETALRHAGWRVLVAWECQIRELEHITARLRFFLSKPL